MLMCIDVGNSNITFGLYDNMSLICSFRMETREMNGAKKMYDEFTIGLSQYNIIEKDISFGIVDSVVPRIDELLKIFFKKLGIEYYFVDYNSNLGINIGLSDPTELGSDILVGVYQASLKYALPAIVIDMGTASTIVLVSEKKELLGGAIIPGVMSSFNNLIKDTSKLVKARVAVPKSVVGKNTVECLQSGMLYGSACEINGLVDMIKDEINISDINVIITGGIASFLNPYINSSVYDENLLIDGLMNIYYKVIKR